MSTKTHYSEADWRAISSAPAAAGLFVTLGQASGPIGLAKEALGVREAIVRTAYGDAPEIVRVLAAHVRQEGGRPELPEVPSGDRAQMQSALLNGVRTAVRAVESKSPGEVEAYKTWLASVTAKVAQASKEGGPLGLSGARVSPEEQKAVSQLADVLGVSAPPPTARSWSHQRRTQWRSRPSDRFGR
jgi:hypothetical protein